MFCSLGNIHHDSSCFKRFLLDTPKGKIVLTDNLKGVGRVELRCLNTNSYGPSGNKVVWGLASLKHLFEAPKRESPTVFFLKSDSFPKGEPSRCLPQDSSCRKKIRLIICCMNIDYPVSPIVEFKGHSL